MTSEPATISWENGFELKTRRRFPGGRGYAFAFAALFVFLLVIYGNSFQGAWVFDDHSNIIENQNIVLKSLDWPGIKKTFFGFEGQKIERPFAYLSFALNRYVGGLDVFGYHLVNFAIHYLAAVFLFLLIRNTLNLPILRERYGAASCSVALLASVLWATSPVQVTAVTYIVQRMASMAGLFYVAALYLYLKGRTADGPWKQGVFFGLCFLSAVLALGSKENAVLLPFSIWLYDLLLIQGASRENVTRNLKVFVPVLIVTGAAALWYADIGAILSGAAYGYRHFTLTERLLTEPRVVVFYMAILLYPRDAWLTLIHDTELSTSPVSPWTTLPAMALILGLIALAVYLARKRPLIAFSILFYFLNHAVESTFLSLDLIYEHRNYIPSLFFFVPVAIGMLRVVDYFSYRKAIQFAAAALFTFFLLAQGHTVHTRNALFSHPLRLSTDNARKTPTLSETYNDLGAEYAKLGLYDKAYELFTKAQSLDRYTKPHNRAITLHNLGKVHLYVTGDCDRALDYFDAGLKAYPKHLPLHFDTVACLIRQGDLDAAESLIASALSCWPSSATLHRLHALVLLKRGKYDDAIGEARRSLAGDADRPETLAVLGEAFLKKGDDRMAAFYWKWYSDRNPNALDGCLALIELYERQKEEEELSRAVGKMLVLKGSKSLDNLIDEMRKNKYVIHVPDREKITATVKKCLDGRCLRP